MAVDWGVVIDLLVGLAAGIVSGLLGVGGGIVLTPVLHYGMGLPFLDAVALSLCVIAIQSPIGVWRHARKDAVDWRIGGWLIAGGVLGVVMGALAIRAMPVALLKVAFGVLLGVAAFRLVQARRPTMQLRMLEVPIIGVLAGFISRLLGVGGGIITVPALSLRGVAVHTAVGTSLVPVFTNAALATGINLAEGLEWMRGIALAIGAIAGSIVGVKAAHALPEDRLKRVVAGGMVLAGLAIIVEAI